MLATGLNCKLHQQIADELVTGGARRLARSGQLYVRGQAILPGDL